MLMVSLLRAIADVDNLLLSGVSGKDVMLPLRSTLTYKARPDSRSEQVSSNGYVEPYRVLPQIFKLSLGIRCTSQQPR